MALARDQHTATLVVVKLSPRPADAAALARRPLLPEELLNQQRTGGHPHIVPVLVRLRTPPARYMAVASQQTLPVAASAQLYGQQCAKAHPYQGGSATAPPPKHPAARCSDSLG